MGTVIRQQAAAKAEVILPGIDLHAARQVVGRMRQTARQFSRGQLVEWTGGQRKSADPRRTNTGRRIRDQPGPEPTA